MEVLTIRIIFGLVVALIPGAGVVVVVGWIARKLGVPMPRWVNRFVKPPRSPRERILFKAFDLFTDWVDAHWDKVHVVPPEIDVESKLGVQYITRMAEISSLYDWWTIHRPARVAFNEEAHEAVRELVQSELEQDDEYSLARLANVWRDLV